MAECNCDVENVAEFDNCFCWRRSLMRSVVFRSTEKRSVPGRSRAPLGERESISTPVVASSGFPGVPGFMLNTYRKTSPASI
jgi:hypothetical protein